MSNDTTNENGEEMVVETTDEVVDTTTDESSDESSDESNDNLNDEVANLRKTIGSLKRELKKTKKTSETETKVAKPSGTVTLEEVALVNTIGMDGLAKAKRLAEIDGVSITDATKSEEFELWQKAEKERARRAESELRASGGGNGAKRKASLSDTGLSKDDHKKLEQEFLNRR